MPTHQPPGPWVRFVIHWQNSDVGWENEIWYRLVSTVAVPNPAQAATDFYTAVGADFLGMLYSDTKLLGITAYWNNGTYTTKAFKPTVDVGALGNLPLPVNVTLVATFFGNISTRQGNGRMFISGLDNTMADGDYPSFLGQTAMSAFTGALYGLVMLAGQTAALSVWDRKTATLVETQRVGGSPKLGTKRRRLPKFG